MPAEDRSGRSRQAAEGPLTFAVLVFPGFPMMAFSSVIEPLRAANVLAKTECYRWVIVGADKGTVEASNGVVIQPGFSCRRRAEGRPHRRLLRRQCRLSRRRRCGCLDAQEPAEAAPISARWPMRRSSSPGPACSTAMPAPCTGPARRPSPRRSRTSSFERDLYVIDRKRFTSAGGVGSLDMMLEIITSDYGGELAAGVAEWFVHSPLALQRRPQADAAAAAHRRPERTGAVGHRHHGGCGRGAARHGGAGGKARRLPGQARAQFSHPSSASRPMATTGASGCGAPPTCSRIRR